MDAVTDDRELWRDVLDALPVAVSVSTAIRDGQGRVVDFRTDYVNELSAALSGIPADEQVGRRATELLPGIVEMDLFRDTVRVVETGEPYVHDALELDVVVAGRRIAGTFQVEAHRFRDGVISVSTDVTARREAEERLARTQGEVQRRRLAQRQVTEVNERIIGALVEVSSALDGGDVRAAQRALTGALTAASRIVTELRAVR